MNELILGIDPGKSGSLCVLSAGKRFNIVDVTKMPETEDALAQYLEHWCRQVEHVFIEAIPKFAGENRSAAFMAVLYGNYKFMCGAVSMFSRVHGGVRLHEVPLLLWMNRAIRSNKRSRERAERKRQLLSLCSELWPEHKWNLATCDAPLIAKFGYEALAT